MVQELDLPSALKAKPRRRHLSTTRVQALKCRLFLTNSFSSLRSTWHWLIPAQSTSSSVSTSSSYYSSHMLSLNRFLQLASKLNTSFSLKTGKLFWIDLSFFISLLILYGRTELCLVLLITRAECLEDTLDVSKPLESWALGTSGWGGTLVKWEIDCKGSAWRRCRRFCCWRDNRGWCSWNGL